MSQEPFEMTPTGITSATDEVTGMEGESSQSILLRVVSKLRKTSPVTESV
jgi:hypothetical protein